MEIKGEKHWGASARKGILKAAEGRGEPSSGSPETTQASKAGQCQAQNHLDWCSELRKLFFFLFKFFPPGYFSFAFSPQAFLPPLQFINAQQRGTTEREEEARGGVKMGNKGVLGSCLVFSQGSC